MLRTHKIRGFTLIELALGLAMVTVGTAIILPALQGSRQQARRNACSDNLKQVALALHNYHDTYKMFPCGWTDNKLSWHVRILPFIEEINLYNKFNFKSPFDPAESYLQKEIAVYRCPADRVTTLSGGLGRSNFAGVMVGSPSNKTGESTHGGGMFGLNSFRRMRDFTDGTSNSLMAGERMSTARRPESPEAFGTEGTWVGLNPGELSIVSAPSLGMPNSKTYGAFSSPHPGGASFIVGDGSVTFLSEKINPRTFEAYCTISGGEVVESF